MKFTLTTLLATVTAVCVALALARYDIALQIAVGLPLVLAVRELVLFGRELNRPNEEPTTQRLN